MPRQSPAHPSFADRSPIGMDAGLWEADLREAGSNLHLYPSPVFIWRFPDIGTPGWLKAIWIRHGMFILSLSRHSFDLALLVVSCF